MIKLKFTKIVLGALLAGCCSRSLPAFAEDTAPETPASCSLADLNDNLPDDLSCSTAGAVVFGTDLTQFVLNQCSTFTTPGQSDGSLKKSKFACITCARKAFEAFRAATKAGLITPTKSGSLGTSKIKKLCDITENDEEDDSRDGQKEPPQSDALESMYNQLRLCLPRSGESVDTEQCSQCGLAVIDSALSSGVINQIKYNVMKQSIVQVCRGGGENRNPEPKPTPGEGENSFDQFFAAVRSCFSQHKSGSVNNPAACASCVQAISTVGLDTTKVTQYVTYATQRCQDGFSEEPK